MGWIHTHCFSLNTEAKQHFARFFSSRAKKEIISSVATWQLPLREFNPLDKVLVPSELSGGEEMSQGG